MSALQSTLFQEDLFPPTKADSAILSAEEWLAGQNAEPELVSLKDGYEPPARAQLQVKAQVVQQATAPAVDQPPSSQKEVCCLVWLWARGVFLKELLQLVKAWHSHRDEIKQLQAQLATANIKIRTLEQSS